MSSSSSSSPADQPQRHLANELTQVARLRQRLSVEKSLIIIVVTALSISCAGAEIILTNALFSEGISNLRSRQLYLAVSCGLLCLLIAELECALCWSDCYASALERDLRISPELPERP